MEHYSFKYPNLWFSLIAIVATIAVDLMCRSKFGPSYS